MIFYCMFVKNYRQTIYSIIIITTALHAHSPQVLCVLNFVGLKYAGSRNKDAQELLYSFALYLVNEVLSPILWYLYLSVSLRLISR